MSWTDFIVGIGFSFLPRRWWGQWHYASTAEFSRAGVVSGLIEMIVFGRYSLIYFERFMVARSKLVANASMNEGTQLWVLAIFIVDFLIQPLSIALLYLTVEGFARGYTAWLHGSVLPSLPLYLLARVQERQQRSESVRALGPRTSDVIDPVSPEELRIFSSRPKDWNSNTTVSYKEEMWEIVKTEELGGPRKFMYHLKRRNSNVAIRALRRYDPDA